MPRNDSPPRGQGAPGTLDTPLAGLLDRTSATPPAEPKPSATHAASEHPPPDGPASPVGDDPPGPEAPRIAEVELKKLRGG